MNEACQKTNAVIEPINIAQQRETVTLSEHYIQLANVAYKVSIKNIDIRFDLSGRCAGMFVNKGRHFFIRYNPWIFAKYYQQNLQSTVPHEIAHYIVWCLYGRKRGIKPHGVQWQEVMEVFQADKSVTCNFDFSGVPQRRQSRYPYQCQCSEHFVSATVHNRIQRSGLQYLCKSCRVALKSKHTMDTLAVS